MTTPGRPPGGSGEGNVGPPGRPYIFEERSTISVAVLQAAAGDPERRLPVLIELNIRHARSLQGADSQFEALWRSLFDTAGPEMIGHYYRYCQLNLSDLRRLIAEDKAYASGDPAQRAIVHVWPDFNVMPLTYRSLVTIKADAAQRAFGAQGRGITWAVVDSGIDAAHPHFRRHFNLSGEAELHRDFTNPDGEGSVERALADVNGHGTHVAGIIAGQSSGWESEGGVTIVEHIAAEDAAGNHELVRRKLDAYESDLLGGVAPMCNLVSLKVLDSQGHGTTARVIRALQYINESVNAYGRNLRIHGVNLSLGYEFNPDWAACGQSPLCVEVNHLVRSGVVVVVAAGNTGYGPSMSSVGPTQSGHASTINDPGNAQDAITVGATHRDAPYTNGISYFSSKGPTADGRLKPDLVAPGEHIISCAAGYMAAALGPGIDEKIGAYMNDSGTSCAAPHVSGAIAAFLSIRREFIGQPERVKEIFLQSAISLGRERYFEGHGLVDLMKAIQSV